VEISNLPVAPPVRAYACEKVNIALFTPINANFGLSSIALKAPLVIANLSLVVLSYFDPPASIVIGPFVSPHHPGFVLSRPAFSALPSGDPLL
jgi:hypothetical protein